MTSLSPDQVRAHLERDGFVTIPNVLSTDEVERYRNACERAVARARTGQWPFVRTLPKQFPPWSAEDASTHGIWGVQHLLHPDLPERLVFAESYFHDVIVDVVVALLGCSREELVLELYNLLCRPEGDFALRWHRDNVGAEASAAEEERRLREAMVHAQWNLALYEDRSLVVVPGSHRRARSDAERAASPFEGDMPGQVAVTLRPGDVVFYDNNILHRGVYDSRKERMTLHGSMGMTKSDPEQARNILQHGIGAWAADADFTKLPEGMNSLAEGMKARLIAMGTGDGVGFTHQD